MKDSKPGHQSYEMLVGYGMMNGLKHIETTKQLYSTAVHIVYHLILYHPFQNMHFCGNCISVN